jgi:hypothetical protein
MPERQEDDKEAPATRAVAELRAIQWELGEVIRRLEALRSDIDRIEITLSDELPEENRRTGPV